MIIHLIITATKHAGIRVVDDAFPIIYFTAWPFQTDDRTAKLAVRHFATQSPKCDSLAAEKMTRQDRTAPRLGSHKEDSGFECPSATGLFLPPVDLPVTTANICDSRHAATKED